MCYKCQVCDRTTPPGQSRLFVAVYRTVYEARPGYSAARDEYFTESVPRREIDHEVNLCRDCHLFVTGTGGTEGLSRQELKNRKFALQYGHIPPVKSARLKDEARTKKGPFKEEDYEPSENGSRPRRMG
jgi:hypothetical protein